MKKITVIGGGVLGSQIAFQIAYCGFDVTIWVRSHESVNRTKTKLLELKKKYTENINIMNTKEGKSFNTWCRGISDYDDFNFKKCIKKVDDAYKNIKFEIDLNLAIKDADLIYVAPLNGESNKVLEPIVEYAHQLGTRICFNAGTTSIKRGFEHIKTILKSAHIVVMNKEEATMTTGIQVRPDTKTEKFSHELIHRDIRELY